MIKRIFRQFVPTKNERELRRMREQVVAINALEPKMRALPAEQFPSKTAELRQRLERIYRDQGLDQAIRITELREREDNPVQGVQEE